MQGRTVTKKTDWFDLQEAHLQLQSYSQPMITQLGGLAGDQETLRADGALRPPALSAQCQCAAPVELRRREIQVRDGRRAVARGGPGGHRQALGPQGLILRRQA